MLGVNRTVRGGQTTGHEFLTIRQSGATLFLEANPSNQQPAQFEASVADADKVVFRNPDHDFPRRISYFRLGTDSLRAEIDDGNGGNRIVFPFRRSECRP